MSCSPVAENAVHEELGMVEEVEDFGPELQAHPLAE